MHHPTPNAAGTEDLFLGQVGPDTAKVRCQRLSQARSVTKEPEEETGSRSTKEEVLEASNIPRGTYIYIWELKWNYINK